MAGDVAGDDQAVTVPAENEVPTDRLETFASIVNHDLRNPLNVAQGRLELARQTGDDEHLEVVARAHDRLAALIEESVTWARCGQSPGDLTSIPLEELVTESWKRVPTGDASLEVSTEREIRADRERLQTALGRLFTNAIEHGGNAVTVRVGDLPDGFYLEDTGPGIPPDQREQAFEPGFSTTPEASGYGLAVVAAITGAHGWTITLTESAEGGARFELRTDPCEQTD